MCGPMVYTEYCQASEDDYDYYEMIDDLLDRGYGFNNVVTLEYAIERNEFIDLSFGNVVHDIYRLLKPWQIFLFKHYKRDYIFPDVTDTFLVELFWPEDEWPF